MVKKGLCIVLTILSVLLFTVSAYAADTSQADEVEAATVTTITPHKTVKDDDGNKFYVLGTSLRGSKGSKAYAKTTFETTYYIKGTAAAKKDLDGKKKKVSAKGTVSMLGGASTSFPSSSSTVKLAKASGSTKRSSDTLLYIPTSIVGTHTFEFNGAKWSALSSN